MKKNITVYGKTPYTMTEEKYAEVANALVHVLQQTVSDKHMMGIISYNMSKVKEIVFSYYGVGSDVIYSFNRWTKRQTLLSLNALICSFAFDYNVNALGLNPFKNLDSRFLSAEELEANQHRLSGYN